MSAKHKCPKITLAIFYCTQTAPWRALTPVPEPVEGPCKILAKKWQGGHFLGLSGVPPLGSIPLVALRTPAGTGSRPPLQSLPCINMQPSVGFPLTCKPGVFAENSKGKLACPNPCRASICNLQSVSPKQAQCDKPAVIPNATPHPHALATNVDSGSVEVGIRHPELVSGSVEAGI